jgi:hypothetical protein
VSESGDSPAACDNHWDGGPVLGGWQGWSGAPAGAAPIAPAAGLVDGADGGAVFVFGQATFAFATEDEVGRRLAAVQLVATEFIAGLTFDAVYSKLRTQDVADTTALTRR